MQENPYQAPSAAVSEVEEDQLASRGDRFLGALIDGLIMLAIILPLMFAGGYFTAVQSGGSSFGLLVKWALIGFIVFVIVQGWPLSQTAQTWGKKVMKMRIVHLDGTQPSLATLLLKRYIPVQVAGAIPFLGSIVGIVDALLIFRDDRRCGHDLIAGTKVIKS